MTGSPFRASFFVSAVRRTFFMRWEIKKSKNPVMSVLTDEKKHYKIITYVIQRKG